MKRSHKKRRMADARMPGPVYRGVHPDREPVAIYYTDGNVAIETDLPSEMMQNCREQAREMNITPAARIISILLGVADKQARGF